jgi:predicted secreted Zn-dependent protease
VFRWSSWGLAAASLAWVVSTVSAQPIQSTQYTYYPVSGASAQEIYKAMLHSGPRVRGEKAYAATSATTTQDGKLLQKNSCQIQDYKLKLNFVIKLPKLRNEKALPVSDRSRWRQFSSFLKKHEETHRSIWLGCAADLEAQVKALKSSTCAEADKKAQVLWERMRSTCNKKHAAFDAAEQRKLMKHPFVKLVYKRSVQIHAANAP